MHELNIYYLILERENRIMSAKELAEFVNNIPDEEQKTLTQVSSSLSYLVKKGTIIKFGYGKYGLPKWVENWIKRPKTENIYATILQKEGKILSAKELAEREARFFKQEIRKPHNLHTSLRRWVEKGILKKFGYNRYGLPGWEYEAEKPEDLQKYIDVFKELQRPVRTADFNEIYEGKNAADLGNIIKKLIKEGHVKKADRGVYLLAHWEVLGFGKFQTDKGAYCSIDKEWS